MRDNPFRLVTKRLKYFFKDLTTTESDTTEQIITKADVDEEEVFMDVDLPQSRSTSEGSGSHRKYSSHHLV